MQWKELTTGAACKQTREALEGERADLKAEEQMIIEQSTERRLAKNRARQREMIEEFHQLERAENHLVSAMTPPERLAEIKRASTQLQKDEAALSMDARLVAKGIRYVPSKYIRLDAVEHFGAEVAEAEKTLAEYERKGRGQLYKRSGQAVDVIKDLEAVVSEWDKSGQVNAEVGQEIAQIRADREALREEQDALEKQHRETVLAV